MTEKNRSSSSIRACMGRCRQKRGKRVLPLRESPWTRTIYRDPRHTAQIHRLSAADNTVIMGNPVKPSRTDSGNHLTDGPIDDRIPDKACHLAKCPVDLKENVIAGGSRRHGRIDGEPRPRGRIKQILVGFSCIRSGYSSRPEIVNAVSDEACALPQRGYSIHTLLDDVIRPVAGGLAPNNQAAHPVFDHVVALEKTGELTSQSGE